jgi:hypothetical protein
MRMTIEAIEVISHCPECYVTPLEPFLRGQVQRSPHRFWWWPFGETRPYCAVICRACKQIVGWESP